MISHSVSLKGCVTYMTNSEVNPIWQVARCNIELQLPVLFCYFDLHVGSTAAWTIKSDSYKAKLHIINYCIDFNKYFNFVNRISDWSEHGEANESNKSLVEGLMWLRMKDIITSATPVQL